MTTPHPGGGAVEAGEAVSPEQIEAACAALCRRVCPSKPHPVIADWRVLTLFYPQQAEDLRQRMSAAIAAARALDPTYPENR